MVWPGGRNSLWTMPWMPPLPPQKKDQHGLDIAANFTCFLRPQWIWRLPLQWVLLSLWVITLHLCFITGYDTGDEVGVVSGLLFEFPADRNAKGLLVVAQQSWHKSCRNASHVQIVRNMHWTVPYDSPTISQTSWIVCLQSARIASQTSAVFSSVVLVDCRPECSSSSTDICPSLKPLYHKKVLLWLMALSPKASCSIRWVSAVVF